MKNNLVILISISILSLSLVFSSLYIGNAIYKARINSQEASLNTSEKLLMNLEQAAEYLGIPVDAFVAIVKKESIEKQNLSAYPTYKYIPYIEIEGIKYFSRIELMKWVEFNMYNK